MATAKISVTALNENYQQAGLRVWTDDNNWASVHMISAGGNRDFEFIYEADGNPRNEGADKLGGIPADSPLDVLRADRLRRREPDRLLLLQRHDVPAGRPARAAVDVRRRPKIGPAALSDLAPSRAGRALRLDPLRPGRHGRRRHRGRRRRLRGHDPRRRLGAHPRRPEPRSSAAAPCRSRLSRATSTRPATTRRT